MGTALLRQSASRPAVHAAMPIADAIVATNGLDVRLEAHLRELLSRPSITPVDAGCQDYLAEVLSGLGFVIERLDGHGVSNLIASTPGQPKLAFSGHTDVVPAGNGWHKAPYQLTLDDGLAYGRGIADMKGAIAAFVTAIQQLPQLPEGLQVLITSDEEGEAEHGSRAIVEHLKNKNQLASWVLIGEPTANGQSGDTLRNGRRGALSGEIRFFGDAGHVAYQTSSENLLHRVMGLGQKLASLEWDVGCRDFPGTNFHLTGIEQSGWLDNVTPSELVLKFNLRYSHRYCSQSIDARIRALLIQSGLQHELSWSRPCEPYFSDFPSGDDNLLNRVEQAVMATNSRYPLLSTAGGASDGRFFAAAGSQVVELGLPNQTIHQANESVPVSELNRLTEIYRQLLSSLN